MPTSTEIWRWKPIRQKDEQTGLWVKRRFRLTRTTDIQRVRRIGKSYAHPLIVLAATPNQLQWSRVGVTAGSTVGGAVERNLVKRRLRAALQGCFAAVEPGWDCLFIARRNSPDAAFTQIALTVESLLNRAGILHKNDGD